MTTVLYIEDDAELREAYADEFRAAGLDVVEAGNGERAIALLDRQPVHVVVTDLLMPDMDGLEVLTRLRDMATPPPVIVLSGGYRRQGRSSQTAARASAGMFQLCRNLGAIAIFNKPTPATHLIKTIHNLTSPVSGLT